MNTTMNTVNQTFDWSRFVSTLHKELVENKRALIITVVSIYVLLTFVMTCGNAIAYSSNTLLDQLWSYVPQKTVYTILLIVMAVGASLSFRSLKRKTSRAAMFSSPSSTLEKFLANVLIYVVGLFVAFLACAQLVDLTRIGILTLYGHDIQVIGTINFMNLIHDTVLGTGTGAANVPGFNWAAWLSLVAVPGLYVLGSIVWPRLSLLKTFVASQAITIALSIIVSNLVNLFIPDEQFDNWMISHLDNGSFANGFAIFMAIQAVLFWGLAWYLFKRKDVVSLKWWK